MPFSFIQHLYLWRTKNIRVVYYSYSTDNLIKIRTDEEFKIKLFSGKYIATPRILLNENEAQKYLQLLENYTKCEGHYRSAAGIQCYTYFHFKALKKTKEDLILKFGIRKDHPIVYNFKINIE